jgi:hypothetical protein
MLKLDPYNRWYGRSGIKGMAYYNIFIDYVVVDHSAVPSTRR